MKFDRPPWEIMNEACDQYICAQDPFGDGDQRPLDQEQYFEFRKMWSGGVFITDPKKPFEGFVQLCYEGRVFKFHCHIDY